MGPVEHPHCARVPKCSNLWLTPSLLGTRQAPRPSLSPNPFKQGSLLPPAGPLGSAPPAPRRRCRCAARGEAPPASFPHMPGRSPGAQLCRASPQLPSVSSAPSQARGPAEPPPPSLRLRSLRLREELARRRLLLPLPHPFLPLREAGRGTEL